MKTLLSFVLLAGCAGTLRQDGVTCHPDGPRIVGSGFDTRSEVRARARSVANGERKPVAIIVVGDIYEGFLDDTRVVATLNDYFKYEVVRIGGEYDETDARILVAEKRQSGEWGEVCLDQYLQMRNGALKASEIETLRKLGVKQTPAVIVTDARGTILAMEEGFEDEGTAFLRTITPYARE